MNPVIIMLIEMAIKILRDNPNLVPTILQEVLFNIGLPDEEAKRLTRIILEATK